jgi:hypothetical protein
MFGLPEGLVAGADWPSASGSNPPMLDPSAAAAAKAEVLLRNSRRLNF